MAKGYRVVASRVCGTRRGRRTGAQSFARGPSAAAPQLQLLRTGHLKHSWESASDWPAPSGGPRRPISGSQALGRALQAWGQRETGDVCSLSPAEERPPIPSNVRRAPDPASGPTDP